MPELPEIHTIVTDLKNNIEGTTIKKVEASQNYDPEFNTHTLSNQKIKSIYRIAKNIAIELSDENTLVIHLAMTGRLLLRSPTYKGKDPYLKLLFTLEKNGKDLHLKYTDKRNFGKAKLLSKNALIGLTNKYGPDPLDKNLNPPNFLSTIKSKNTKIKNALLDQSVISGMGNAYATDALWIAQIHPETKTQDMTINDAQRLLEAAQAILKEGISNRGISMSDYVDAFGKKGRQQEYFRVYRQDTCPKCSTKVEFIKINGRGTYYCPNCQVKGDQKRLI